MADRKLSTLKRRLWYIVLFIPFFVAVWVPFFNRIEPSLFGIPFFYWFQFVWIVVAAIVTGLAYLAKV
ncbi:MAG TPA: DUF3311 domain-containing protein [Gammaproteobacteria bacterium]|nr:DUF3311 domain-containing protein [Gammaproteobacteria bacterium]